MDPDALRQVQPEIGAQNTVAEASVNNPQQPDAKAISFTTIDYPGASFSLVLDTNASTAVGMSSFDGGNTLHAFSIKGT
jgi:hypothetical protein